MTLLYRFHLIANAHLDPVWLWDWREGLNETVNTTTTMLALLDEFPELTVIRGETALYEFLEHEVPDVFARVRAMVKAGRWEPIGGTYVQCDNNLPTTETIRRQFVEGQTYLETRFGQRATTAWFPDTFGHSAGLPEIFAANGIRQFAHCRPFPSTLPLAEPAYWWVGAGGERILSYRSPVAWYCHERHGLPDRLDAYLREAQRGQLRTIAVFYGLGDHGGGPTRRMLRELREWAARHPDVEMIHSGLDRYFAAVREEMATRPEFVLPEVRGELGYCLRGCYASVARFKFPFRRAEHALIRAGKVAAVAATNGARADVAPLAAAWRAVLFNSFHDILAGSSIERAYLDQIAQVGGAVAEAQRVEFAALNALARRADTTVAAAPDDAPGALPFLVCNPHLFAYAGPVEFEVQLDWRPLPGAAPSLTAALPIEVLGSDGASRPFQRLATENRAMVDLLWRMRIVTPVDLPPGGWEILRVGYREGAVQAPRRTALRAEGPGMITNGVLTVRGTAGGETLQIIHRGRSLLPGGSLSVRLLEDPFGSWGEMEESSSMPWRYIERERWAIAQVKVLEEGPELVRMWVRFAGARSRLDLTVSLVAEVEEVALEGRLFLDERSARVELVLPGVERARFEVPGGDCERGAVGQVPGIGAVEARGSGGGFVFASDALSSFRIDDDALHVVLARAARYADDVVTRPDVLEHLPAVDAGELRFRAAIAPPTSSWNELGTRLQQPVIVQSVPAFPGPLGRQGAGLALPAPVSLVSAELTDAGIRLVVQNRSNVRIEPALEWKGAKVATPGLNAWQLATWDLRVLGDEIVVAAERPETG